MKLPDFRRALEAAFNQHLPGIRLIMTESRGVALTCRAEIAENLLLAVYFNALTGNTSYALVRGGGRIAGYDNHRFFNHVQTVALPLTVTAALIAVNPRLRALAWAGAIGSNGRVSRQPTRFKIDRPSRARSPPRVNAV